MKTVKYEGSSVLLEFYLISLTAFLSKSSVISEGIYIQQSQIQTHKQEKKISIHSGVIFYMPSRRLQKLLYFSAVVTNEENSFRLQFYFKPDVYCGILLQVMEEEINGNN